MKKSFDDIQCFFYKIPDAGGSRGDFSISRPFDCIAEIDGKLIAFEGKAASESWSYSSIRDTQEKGLSKVESYKKNRSYVFVCLKESRGRYWCVIFPWRVISKTKKGIGKRTLENYPYKILRDNRAEAYDLRPFVEWFRTGL